jgi:hypothetical protein
MEASSFNEYGSEFHFPDFDSGVVNVFPGREKLNFYGSGRDALKALIYHALDNKLFNCIYLPDYFCSDVVEAVESTGIDFKIYKDFPGCEETEPFSIDFSPGDAILIVNFFGLKPQKNRSFNGFKPTIIEDHTHDPFSNWAFNSVADYCIASLRKNLPVPDGGILWSPQQKKLPLTPDASNELNNASLLKFSGMLLKRLYLKEKLEVKPLFRQMFSEGEAGFSAGKVSGITAWSKYILENISIEKWRVKRKENFNIISDLLISEHLEILRPQNEDCVPSGVVVLFKNNEQRDFVRTKLVEEKIYTSVLWPLKESILHLISSESKELSERLLSIHADVRYSQVELKHAAYRLIFWLNQINKSNGY